VFGFAAEESRGLLWVAITLCDESFVESGCREEEAQRKPRVSTTMEEGNKPIFGVCPWEAMWYLLIDPERPGKNDFASGPSLSDAGALKVHL